MTKAEWLRRCETVYDMGFVKDRSVTNVLRHMAEAGLRLRHVLSLHPELFSGIEKDHQGGMAMSSLKCDWEHKNGVDVLRHTLAGDKNAYAAECMASVFDHPCQRCGEDKNAWHTRYSYCNHR